MENIKYRYGNRCGKEQKGNTGIHQKPITRRSGIRTNEYKRVGRPVYERANARKQ